MANSNPKEPTPTPKERTPTPKESTPAPKESTPAPKESTPAPKELIPTPGPSAGSSAGISAGISTGSSASNSADQKCPKVKNPKTLQSRMERMKEKNDTCLNIAKQLDTMIREMQGKDTMHDLQNEAIYHMMRSENFAEQVVHARSFIPNVSAIKHNMDYEKIHNLVYDLEICLAEMRSI